MKKQPFDTFLSKKFEFFTKRHSKADPKMSDELRRNFRLWIEKWTESDDFKSITEF